MRDEAVFTKTDEGCNVPARRLPIPGIHRAGGPENISVAIRVGLKVPEEFAGEDELREVTVAS